MNRTLLTCVLLVCALTAAFGQQQSTPASKPETVRLEAQPQQEIGEAQRVANEARAALEAASARYDAAQQKVVTSIYKAMADAGLKPKEWAIKQDQAGIYFERIKPVETAAATTPPSQSSPGKP